MNGMTATLTQHPVGQGGMMSGLLKVPGGQFHWAYDCGSNQKDALNREIASVASKGHLDCLFLSHLDSDHVNGIDNLLQATTVGEVVLPYLNDIDRLLAVARDASSGSLTGSFIELLSDTPGWFGKRGVQRVTFIRPNEDDDEARPSTLPDGGRDGGGEGRIIGKWLSDRIDHDTHLTGPEPPEKVETMTLDTSASMCLTAGGGTILDWLIAPYAHRPSDQRLKKFEKAIEASFGTKPLDSEYWSEVMSDRGKRKILRECYDVIWSDHNLVSMALYAGPVRSKGWQARYHMSNWLWPHSSRQEVVGWLGTGDMHLDVAVRRQGFLNHYGALLDKVDVFGIPHHGSHRNFHPDLIGSLSNAVHYVAATGPNSYGHPHRLVIDAIESAGRRFMKVGHRGRSRLQSIAEK